MEPELGFGLWNAWLFMAYLFLPMPLLVAAGKLSLWSAFSPPSNGRELAPWLLWLAGFGYSLVLPLRVGTAWLIVGLPIALVGAVAFGTVIAVWLRTTDTGRPYASGPYRYSRHPMYVTQAVMCMGVSIACASPVFLAYTLLTATMTIGTALREEAGCLERYGEVYGEYMRRTPRWLGMPRRGGKEAGQ